jgi:sterol desaturase/sphingolipid hydroxylase (fatty acid hydroxylase superfamily)
MFESDLFERFSRAHPLAPAVLYLPLAALSVGLGWQQSGLVKTLLGVGAGYLLWTVVEYWLHRLVFHLPVIGPKTARVAFVLHGVHHDNPSDETRLVMPLGASLPMGVATYFAFRALLGAAMWGPFAGFVIGYVIYDEVHWYLHAAKPTTRVGRWLRREHFLHHFSDSNSRFGVSCPWLDYAFLTRGAPRKSTGGTSESYSSPAE